MRKSPVIVGLLLTTGIGWAAESRPAVQAMDPAGIAIEAQARCVPTAGIPIPEVADNEVKVACLKDYGVRAECNPDGNRARLQAWRSWVSQMTDFKERCASVGGVFAYADPSFREPTDAAFCSVPQPEVNYDAFETPLCNFVSQCPKVVVSCLDPDDALPRAPRTVQLPGVPQPVSVLH
jgi:hypothetical protein